MERIQFTLAATFLIGVAGLHAASFDCSKARTGTERVICGNEDLSKTDEVMADAYRRAQAAMQGQGRIDLQNQQREWLARRSGCGYNEDCLKRRYQERIAELQSYIHEQPVAGQSPADNTPAVAPSAVASPVPPEAASTPATPTAIPTPEAGQSQETSTAPPPSDQPVAAPPVKQPQSSDTVQSANSATTAQPASSEKEQTPPLAGFILFALTLLSAYIAKKKGRTFWKWWIYSIFLLPIALPHALLMRRGSPEANQPASLVQAPAAPSFQVLSPTDVNGIRQRLQQYSEYGKAECVHCGYTGHMGLVKRTKPLHENGLFKLAAFMNRGAVRNWYAASAFMGGVAKIVLQCPACGSLWEQKVGGRPSLFLIGR